MDPLVMVFGLGVGVLIGMTGIGGGSLMTPLLILFAGVHPTVAIGTDLAYGALTKTVGGWRHLRKGTVDLGVSKWLAFGSVPGSILGVVLLDAVLKRRPDILLTGVAVALLVVAVSILFRALFLQAAIARERDTVVLTTTVKASAVGLGAVLGLLLGLTSVGSGALIGLALILVFRLTPHRVVGTDVFHAAIVLWAAGLAQGVAGNIDFVLMGNILIGSLPGVLIGTALIDRIPSVVLRPLLGCVLLGSALGVLTKAGVDLPTWTIVGVPALVGLAFTLVHRGRARHRAMNEKPTPEVVPV
ncbi:sulfite exporter TauE/SafE family protein [Baekduia soli]|uniref:Probable membrane transporter protein n=1 Tax=Baekduia soli TaxID=496014 RepID=A0A5B8TZZ3_9ACTN|nr:sulfite exporter TauE/SafE family protein [Baekduia soli]QEC46299.1 sulfite exporter TauE/SafE family protein [Baekduia soli]